MSTSSFDISDRLPSRSRRIYRSSPTEGTENDLRREPQSHLSNLPVTGTDMASSILRTRGSPANVLNWWQELPLPVRDIINNTIFRDFIATLSTRKVDKVGIIALAERWWDTTNTFHLPLGEVTMTPYDFFMLTGLPFTRKAYIFDENYYAHNRDRVTQLLGATPPFDVKIDYTWFNATYRNPAAYHFEDNPVDNARVARAFLLFMLGNTIFSESGSHVHVYHLAHLENLDELYRENWGGAGLSVLYRTMCDLSRRKLESLMGYSIMWEAWAAEILGVGRPPLDNVVDHPEIFPRLTRFHALPKLRLTMRDRRVYLDDLTVGGVSWNPWITSRGSQLPGAAAAHATANMRILLDGPSGLFWYLGERVQAQVRGDGLQIRPAPPPPNMRWPESLTGNALRRALRGDPAADLLITGDNYQAFVATFLGGRLTPRPAPQEQPIPAEPEAQTRFEQPPDPDFFEPRFSESFHFGPFETTQPFTEIPVPPLFSGTFPGPSTHQAPPQAETFQRDPRAYYIPYPTGSVPRHSAAAYLDWSVPNVTPTGIVEEPIPLPTEPEWDRLPDPETVTREDFKKSLGLIAGLKKWASNLSAKMSCLSVSHDHLQNRVRFLEEQEARRRRHAQSSTTAPGPSGAHAPGGSVHRGGMLQRSQTSRRPEGSQASSRRRRHREDEDVTSSRLRSGSRRDS